MVTASIAYASDSDDWLGPGYDANSASYTTTPGIYWALAPYVGPSLPVMSIF